MDATQYINIQFETSFLGVVGAPQRLAHPHVEEGRRTIRKRGLNERRLICNNFYRCHGCAAAIGTSSRREGRRTLRKGGLKGKRFKGEEV